MYIIILIIFVIIFLLEFFSKKKTIKNISKDVSKYPIISTFISVGSSDTQGNGTPDNKITHTFAPQINTYINQPIPTEYPLMHEEIVNPVSQPLIQTLKPFVQKINNNNDDDDDDEDDEDKHDEVDSPDGYDEEHDMNEKLLNNEDE